MTTGVLVTGDLGDVVQNLMDRVAQLEQRITSPNYTVPNGSSPTFGTVKIGDIGGTVIPINDTSSSPTSLSGTPGASVTETWVDLTWTAPVDGSAQSYIVEITTKDAGGTYTLYDSVPVLGASAHITGLTPHQTYGFKVFSVNTIGIPSTPVPASGYYDVTTIGDSGAPTAPTGVTATAGLTSVMITWNDNPEPDVANGQGFYEVDWSTSATFSTSVQTVRVGSSLASFVGLTAGTPYYFRVRAFDSSGNPGPYSATVSATPGTASVAPSDGAAPTSSPTPSTPLGGVGFIYLRWSAVINADPVIYDVHMGTATGFTVSSSTLAVSTSATGAFIKSLPDGTAMAYGTTYYFKVVARDHDGSAAAGGEVSGQMTKANGAVDIAAGTITAASGVIASLDAGVISTGTLDAARIATNSLNAAVITAGTFTSDRVVSAGLDAGVIKFGTMSGDRITANTLDINAIKTSTLTAKTITLASNGQIQAGNTTNGVIFNGTGINGYKGGVLVFQINTSGTAFFKGDISGATGTFSGNLNVTTGTITGATYQTAASGKRIVLATADRIQLWTAAPAESTPAEIISTNTGGIGYLTIKGANAGGGYATISLSSGTAAAPGGWITHSIGTTDDYGNYITLTDGNHQFNNDMLINGDVLIQANALTGSTGKVTAQRLTSTSGTCTVTGASAGFEFGARDGSTTFEWYANDSTQARLWKQGTGDLFLVQNNGNIFSGRGDNVSDLGSTGTRWNGIYFTGGSANGILTTSSAANFYINPTNGNLFRSTSSKRYKTDIRPHDVDYSFLDKVRSVHFRDKEEVKKNPNARTYIGFVAEEVHEAGFTDLVDYIVPSKIVKHSHETPPGEGAIWEPTGEPAIPDSVMYERVAVMHHAILKGHNDRIIGLEQMVATLRDRLLTLEGKQKVRV